jgi:hypothetical protein
VLWPGSTPVTIEIVAYFKDEILHPGYFAALLELEKILLMVEDRREFSL